MNHNSIIVNEGMIYITTKNNSYRSIVENDAAMK